MKNNTKKLLIILLILVGVFVVVKFTGDNDRSKSYRSSLVEIDTARATKIEILSPDDSVVVTKVDGQWELGNGKKADKNAVRSLMANLELITPSRIASRSKEQWKDFQVDEQGTRVKVFEGDEKVLDIILGRFDVEGQRSFFSYVRLDEDEDTYVADDFMKMSIGTSSADYRRDDILKINKDSLSRIEFDYPDSAFSLYKVSGKWQLEGQPADSAATAKYISGLSSLSSKQFADRPSSDPIGKIVYHMGENSYRVAMYEDGLLGSSYNPDEYWDDQGAYDKLFVGRSTFSPND